MLRSLIAEFKEFPATMTLGVLWVAVFALMLATSLRNGQVPTAGQVLVGNVGAAHRFGDMTLDEVFHGEIWRSVTCTFVHYNALHIGMNLFGLYQLGCLVESWYGPAQFLGIYVAIGGGGNLISAAIRRALRSNPEIHSGGGSTVVLGLVALCAVVGWRSKTRIGDYLKSQMVGILVSTAALGMVLPIIDNWGHAGGAMVGAAIGFAHRRLVRTAHRPIAHAVGVVGVLSILVCGIAQFREDRTEAPRRDLVRAKERWQSCDRTIAALLQLQMVHQGSSPPTKVAAQNSRVLLDAVKDELDRAPTAAGYRRLRELALQDGVMRRVPAEDREFETLIRGLVRQLMRRRDETIREYLDVRRQGRGR